MKDVIYADEPQVCPICGGDLQIISNVSRMSNPPQSEVRCINKDWRGWAEQTYEETAIDAVKEYLEKKA